MKNIIETMNIPPKQMVELKEHINWAKDYICTDNGQEEALFWLHKQTETIRPEYAEAIISTVKNNLPDPEVGYLETGYDSCQSHRKLAKVVGELFLVGGLTYEAKLLGLDISFDQVLKTVKSELIISRKFALLFCQMAQELGGCQDFIFPGVTKTDSMVPDLEDFTWLTLTGKPIITVRNITGVGGLRKDRDWNWATDLPTFVDLKVKEDKRYYPGMGIFYWLTQNSLDQIPALKNLDNSVISKKVFMLKRAIDNTSKSETEGLSVLCSAYIPPWSEMKKWLPYQAEGRIVDLGSAFHSPSYEFNFLNRLFLDLASGKIPDQKYCFQFDDLISKLSHLWSFNSTIHLPWTSELAGLSNNLVGKITNLNGDYCQRFGIGHKGKSFEIREYHFGQERLFPMEYAGKVAYSTVFYPNSDVFEGEAVWEGLNFNNPSWEELKKYGLINTLLKVIETHE